MTVEDVKAERATLVKRLQQVAAPLIEEFELKTGVVAQVRADHIDVTTFGGDGRRYRVEMRVVLDWEA